MFSNVLQENRANTVLIKFIAVIEKGEGKGGEPPVLSYVRPLPRRSEV